MAKFRKKSVVVEAVQLRWDTWSEMCEHAGVGLFSEYKPEGCYVDANRHITNDGNDRIGMKIPRDTSGFFVLAVENDWVVRDPNGKLYPYPPFVFAQLYERDADYKTAFEPDWEKYDILASALAGRSLVDQELASEDLRQLLVEARADAVRYISDVKADELTKAHAEGVSEARGIFESMTKDQLLQALENVGCDLKCDACSATFFTGSVMTEKHSCPKGR